MLVQCLLHSFCFSIVHIRLKGFANHYRSVLKYRFFTLVAIFRKYRWFIFSDAVRATRNFPVQLSFVHSLLVECTHLGTRVHLWDTLEYSPECHLNFPLSIRVPDREVDTKMSAATMELLDARESISNAIMKSTICTHWDISHAKPFIGPSAHSL